MAAIITDAYVKRRNNFKFKVIVCTIMLVLLIVEQYFKIYYVILLENYVDYHILCKLIACVFFNIEV